MFFNSKKLFTLRAFTNTNLTKQEKEKDNAALKLTKGKGDYKPNVALKPSNWLVKQVLKIEERFFFKLIGF
ncbi:hypothetical protein TS70_04930 [Spiroplasma sp. hyd1]|nr:hypothetical protein [Spiroplasma sp. hyd1]